MTPTEKAASGPHTPEYYQPMKPTEAAEYVRLDEKTITRWARQGSIPAHPLGEGKRKFWRFLKPELDQWLMSKTNQECAA